MQLVLSNCMGGGYEYPKADRASMEEYKKVISIVFMENIEALRRIIERTLYKL